MERGVLRAGLCRLLHLDALGKGHSEIGDHCIVGANSLVTQRFVAPAGSMILGSPAKVTRALTDKELNGLRPWAEKYIKVAAAHAALGK